jgi:nucleotide-binding universal stress UspA family protein
MIRVNSILHPSDFSENSNRALQYACALADHFEARLHLVHIVANRALSLSAPLEAGYLPESYDKDLRASSNDALAKLPEKDWFKGEVVRACLVGTTFVEIIRYAKEHDVDMIVMGTHGRTGIAHLIMGSVAENVVRKAPCPVLTVHPEDHQFVMP